MINTAFHSACKYSKICVKRPLSKRLRIGFQDQLSLNAGQKYCRMPLGEHSVILLNFIKLPFVIKIFVLSISSGCFTQVLLYMLKTVILQMNLIFKTFCRSVVNYNSQHEFQERGKIYQIG